MKPIAASKKIILIVISFSLLLTSGGIMAWQSDIQHESDTDIESGSDSKPVKAMIISETDDSYQRSFPALIHVDREVKLAFRVGGVLSDIHATMGQKINKGDTLAQLDIRDYKLNVLRLSAAIEEAEASLSAMEKGARAEDISILKSDLDAARSVLDKEKMNLDRNEKLIKDKLVTKHAYDQSFVAYESAKARVNASVQSLNKATKGARTEDLNAAKARIKRLKADLTAAQYALSDTSLKAPFSGYINETFAENFESVAPGQPIVSLLDFSGVEARTSIPEDMMIKKDEFKSMFCTLDSFPGLEITAEVKEIGKKTSRANQSYPLVVTLNLPVGIELQPGMSATIHINLNNLAQESNGFSIPVHSVFSDKSNESYVWVINPETQCIRKQAVKTGSMKGDTIQIVEGLQEGDQMVTTGVKFLFEGQKVRLMDANGESRS